MAEHVSFFWGKAQAGKGQALVEQMRKWEQEQKPKAKGFISSMISFGNNNSRDEFCGVVRWDNTENYLANAARPEQDAWYRELMQHADGEIQWFDAALAGEWRA